MEYRLRKIPVKPFATDVQLSLYEALYSYTDDDLMISIGKASSRGLKKKRNDDHILVSRRYDAFVVADGMDDDSQCGVKSSEIATNVAIAAIDGSAAYENAKGVLEKAIASANLELLRRSSILGTGCRLRSTIMIGMAKRGALHLGHVGDSKAYLIRNYKIRQLTIDHSLTTMLDGVIPRQSGLESVSRSVTRALGVSTSVPVEYGSANVTAGDLAVFCTDGVWRILGECEILRLVSRNIPLGGKAKVLVDAARIHGGPDDASAIILDIEANPDPMVA